MFVYSEPIETKYVRVPGDPLVLDCTTHCESDEKAVWYFKGNMVKNPYGVVKYLASEHNGLVVMNATKEDEGHYICVVGNLWFTQYNVTLPRTYYSLHNSESRSVTNCFVSHLLAG